MSTSMYPQGMKSWNNHVPQGGYRSWKGTGMHSNPVGVAPTHIRPLTNKDPGNMFPTGQGLPRPIKHYRKGRVIPVPTPPPSSTDSRIQRVEMDSIERNLNRAVKSSAGQSLGGGAGGAGMIATLIDAPGIFLVKENSPEDTAAAHQALDGGEKIDAECTTCTGVGIVSDWYPINNLTEKPQENVTNPLLCCNEQRKARRRVLPSNTVLPKSYFQTSYMYLFNRCQTFDQREFNFQTGASPEAEEALATIVGGHPDLVTAHVLEATKPGEPLSYLNQYVAQCNPNGTIDAGSKIVLFEGLMNALYDRGLITEVELQEFKAGDAVTGKLIYTMQAFVAFLDAHFSGERRRQIAAVLDALSAIPSVNAALFSAPSNPRGCKRVYYKPNNAQFAQQGAVDAGTRTFKLNVTTIEKNSYNISKNGVYNSVKQKSSVCQPSTYVGNPFFFSGQHQNMHVCAKAGALAKAGAKREYVSVNQHSSGNYIGAVSARG